MVRHDSMMELRDGAEDSVRLSRKTERRGRGMQKRGEEKKKKKRG